MPAEWVTPNSPVQMSGLTGALRSLKVKVEPVVEASRVAVPCSRRQIRNKRYQHMAFFGDMQQAVEDYPSIALTYAFEALEVVDGTDGVINVNEKWKFKVRVSNSGALNMNNVTLHIDGENGTQVSADPAGPFTGGQITTAPIDGLLLLHGALFAHERGGGPAERSPQFLGRRSQSDPPRQERPLRHAAGRLRR
jgi:hypothetical protein